MSRSSNSIFPSVKQRIKDIIDSERWFQEGMRDTEIPYSAGDLVSEALNSIYCCFRSKVFRLSDIEIDNLGIFRVDATSERILFVEDENLRNIIEGVAAQSSPISYLDERDQLTDEILKTILTTGLATRYDPRTGYPGESEDVGNIILALFVHTICSFLACRQQVYLVGIGKLFFGCGMKIEYEPTSDLLESLRIGKLQSH